jgi:hypothetical protein
MATFNEIAVLVAEDQGRALDPVFLEQAKARAKYWYSRLRKNTLDKSPQDRKHYIQSVTLELEEVDAAACSLPLDCKVWRTKEKVPTPFQANNILFDYVGSVDHGNPFKYTKRWELPFLLANKYMVLVTSFYAYEDGYIISNVPWITIEGVFDDPEQVAELSCGGAACPDAEDTINIPGNLAQLIVQSILTIDFGKPKKEEDNEEVQVAKPNP